MISNVMMQIFKYKKLLLGIAVAVYLYSCLLSILEALVFSTY